MKLSLKREELDILAKRLFNIRVTEITPEKGVTITLKLDKVPELTVSLKPLAEGKLVPVELSGFGFTGLLPDILLNSANYLASVVGRDAASIIAEAAPGFIRRESRNRIEVDLDALCRGKNIPFSPEINSVEFAYESVNVELEIKE